MCVCVCVCDVQLNFHLKIVNPTFAAMAAALPAFVIGMVQAQHNTENWRRMAEGIEPVSLPPPNAAAGDSASSAAGDAAAAAPADGVGGGGGGTAPSCDGGGDSLRASEE